MKLEQLPELPDHELYAIVTQWTPQEAEAYVQQLKDLVDAYWWKDVDNAVKASDCLITIGLMREEMGIVALGKMSLGDSLNIQGMPERAWELLDEAGELFIESGDEVSWARTRVGRLALSINFAQLEQGFADAEKAREIFRKHKLSNRLLRLELNTGVVRSWAGDYAQSIVHSRDGLALLDRGEADDHNQRPLLLNNLGYAYSFLGDLKQAQNYYNQARLIFLESQAENGVAIAELNLAYVDYLQGRYRRALYLLHGVLHKNKVNQSNSNLAQQIIIQCYLSLNRFKDAARLAEEVVQTQNEARADYEKARTLGHLGSAVMAMGEYARAAQLFAEALAIFERIPAPALMAGIQLARGKLALLQGDLETALSYARDAGHFFAETDQKINYASALLLEAQVLSALKEYAAAAQTSALLLAMAKRTNVNPLRYNAHLLLAQLANISGSIAQAVRHYRAAIKVLQQIRQELSITLRTDFLQDKVGAFRALITLYIDAGHTGKAFEILEEEKAQLLVQYRSQHESLRLSGDDAHSVALLRELDLRRAEHYALINLDEASDSDLDELLAKQAEYEAQMRQITEQLHLKVRQTTSDQPHIPSYRDIQARLSTNMVMLSYHDDGSTCRVFILQPDPNTDVRVIQLPATLKEVSDLQRKFEKNVDDAIRYGADSPFGRNITSNAQTILRRLHELLLAPVMSEIAPDAVLRIVPYGLLHFTPFHLLYDGSSYLLERHEVSILPAAALVVDPPVEQPAGALVLSHSSGGVLPNTYAEAADVWALCGGDLYREDDARMSVLQAAPRKVLHIAAHGKQRPDQPEFSFIELANGQLYMDDLLHRDLSYELVTLSACETGRSSIFAGEEIIGLGRGFLLSGAGALITTLWRISDHHTVDIMRALYERLREGASKSAALRQAMLKALDANPTLHPAFWGSFQIIGDIKPLSGIK